MKTYRLTLICVLALGGAQSVYGQDAPANDPFRPFLESKQGQPGKPDVIDHGRALKGVHLRCTQVESNPRQGNDSRACILRFEGTDAITLGFGRSLQVPKDGEGYLECLGDKPTRCTLGIWEDPQPRRDMKP